MKQKLKKICVVTGTRAEYGLLFWLMSSIKEDPDLELQIVATGSHLSPEFGLTYRQIEKDGFTINKKIEMVLSADTPSARTDSASVELAQAPGRLHELAFTHAWADRQDGHRVSVQIHVGPATAALVEID